MPPLKNMIQCQLAVTPPPTRRDPADESRSRRQFVTANRTTTARNRLDLFKRYLNKIEDRFHINGGREKQCLPLPPNTSHPLPRSSLSHLCAFFWSQCGWPASQTPPTAGEQARVIRSPNKIEVAFNILGRETMCPSAPENLPPMVEIVPPEPEELPLPPAWMWIPPPPPLRRQVALDRNYLIEDAG